MRTIPIHRNPAHMAAVAMIIVERIVPDTAIVPKGYRPFAPAKAAGETLFPAVIEQKSQQGFALMARHIFKPQGEGGVYIESLFAVFGMGADNRMFRFWCFVCRPCIPWIAGPGPSAPWRYIRATLNGLQ